jgi:glutathione synthase/RimK-type ligase-like ATP-grasp enzyme
LSKITLVSKQNETLIKSRGEELSQYDAVFIQARTTLAPFIEPLLEELELEGTYTTSKKGSYYLGMNEPYQFVALSIAKIPIPKSITSGNAKNIEHLSKKLTYPLLAKSFIGKNVQQAIVVSNVRALNNYVKSIKTEIDGFMIRQYSRADVISCAVIGEKIFAIKRKYVEGITNEINEGKMYKVNEKEETIAIDAARACGYDIARVDICKGKVVKVDPLIPWKEFDSICSEKIEDNVANFLIQKATQNEGTRKIKYDFLGLRKLFAKTIFGRLFK